MKKTRAYINKPDTSTPKQAKQNIARVLFLANPQTM
jgi:hypothetical protein